MSMNTNLMGRLKNTDLPKSHGLLPLFEAVVNSIHSIEECGIPFEDGLIQITIIRDFQQSIAFNGTANRPGPESKADITGFEISDNGKGFDEANFTSFQTLDSQHKADKGCRGIGRLLWLKAFSSVEIRSVYKEADVFKRRTFLFSSENGITSNKVEEIETGGDVKTIVRLNGFVERYQKASKKSLQSISESLLDHCLWYFIRKGSVPHIVLRDGDDIQKLDALFEEKMVSEGQTEMVTIRDQQFDFTHVKISSIHPQNSIAYCAANRLVKEEPITGKMLPGLYGKIVENDIEYSYRCFVSSTYLDERVRAERTGFNIEDNVDGLFKETEITLSDIREKVLESIKIRLHNFLISNIAAGVERVEKFIAEVAPRYRPIVSRLSEEERAVDPSTTNKEIDLMLHKKLAEFETQVLEDGHKLLSETIDGDTDDYERRLTKYLSEIAEIKQSDLANYVSHRKVVLDLFERAIERNANGKYVKEEIIHRLIMPMTTDSDNVEAEKCNLWLIDERLAFHNYLASDKTLHSMPITGSDETKEPDLVALNIFDNPLLVSENSTPQLASISVIEIKRPMRNDASEGEDKDPIEQALGYLNRIRKGEVTTKSGRPIPESNSIPGYCYVLADLTSKMIDRCDMKDLTPTHDRMGYFGYNSRYNAYIEVISFDGLLRAAKERNRAFFDKLGLPSN